MTMIKVENLTFSYPSSYDMIFENVNFQIDTDWKLGFIGRNDLFKFIAGKIHVSRENSRAGTVRVFSLYYCR